MKLVVKLTAALMLAVCTLFGLYGYVSIRRQAALYETDIRRDQRTLSRALAVAVGEIWRTQGGDRALDLVALADVREAKMHVRWVDPAAGGALDDDLAAALRAGRAQVRVEREPATDGRVVTYRPVVVDGRTVGAIEVSESLAEEQRYVRERIWRAVATVALMGGVSGVIATLLGAHLVGRPIRTLIDKARRTGAGDFSRPLALRQRDEIGELGVEMNAMAERLAQATARLAAETDARLSALEQLRHAERLTTVGTLAAGIAHELGTPLNVVAGRAKMIGGETAGGEPARHARIIVDQVERMASIIRQLLDFARLRPPEPGAVDLHASAEQTAALLAPLARKRQVRIAVAGGAAPALVDGAQIQQVLANVIMNAVQASPAGGTVRVDLARRAGAPPGDPGCAPRSCVVVAVEDEGPGIDASALPHIFEPFFTTKGVGEGTGLGLSVAYGIVREHGGWIQVRSAPDTGTRFELWLPEASA